MEIVENDIASRMTAERARSLVVELLNDLDGRSGFDLDEEVRGWLMDDWAEIVHRHMLQGDEGAKAGRVQSLRIEREPDPETDDVDGNFEALLERVTAERADERAQAVTCGAYCARSTALCPIRDAVAGLSFRCTLLEGHDGRCCFDGDGAPGSTATKQGQRCD